MEPFTGRKPPNTFAFLLSKHRRLPPDLLSVIQRRDTDIGNPACSKVQRSVVLLVLRDDCLEMSFKSFATLNFEYFLKLHRTHSAATYLMCSGRRKVYMCKSVLTWILIIKNIQFDKCDQNCLGLFCMQMKKTGEIRIWVLLNIWVCSCGRSWFYACFLRDVLNPENPSWDSLVTVKAVNFLYRENGVGSSSRVGYGLSVFMSLTEISCGRVV